jgi:hypothetical protein
VYRRCRLVGVGPQRLHRPVAVRGGRAAGRRPVRTGQRVAVAAEEGVAVRRRCESGRCVSSNAPAGALRAESRRTRSGARPRPRARTSGAAASPPRASGRRRSAITAATVLALKRQYRSCRSAVIGASRRSPDAGQTGWAPGRRGTGTPVGAGRSPPARPYGMHRSSPTSKPSPTGGLRPARTPAADRALDA